MSDPIAEAFVSIRADLSQFEGDVQAGIVQATRGIAIPPSTQAIVGQQLFGPGFVQQARTSTTRAINQTQIPTTTQQRLAQAMFGPGFRNESGRAIQGALVGLGQGELAARFAFFGAGGAAVAALGAGFLFAAQQAGTFEQSLNTLQAVTGVADDDLRQLSDLAKQLGADITLPAVTAQTAADAMTELAKAGLSVDDVMGAVRGTLQLSTAANIDAASAARIAATALNAFSLAGNQASHVADLLAAASVSSQGDITDLAQALQQSAAVASLSGLSIEQLVGALTELANRGLIGSDAGTSLRVALLRLIPTTREAAQFMEILGIRIDRTKTLGQQLPELLDQYQRALGRLNPTLRQAVLAQIAGQDAVRSLSFLIQGGGDELERYTALADQSGAAQRLAEARTKGFLGAVEGLNSQVQTLAINIGNLFIPALERLVRSITNIIEPVNTALDALNKLDNLSIDVEINWPELPDFLKGGGPLIHIGDILPDVNFGLQIAQILNPALGAFTSLEAKARAISDILDAAGFGPAASEADKLAASAKKLNDELFSGDTTRARAIEIQRQIAEIEAKLKTLATQAETSGAKLKGAFEGKIVPIDALQGPFAILEQQLANAVDPNVLGRQLSVAIQQLRRGDLSQQTREAAQGLVRSLIDQLETLGPEGERVLTALGGRLITALGDGITREEQRAIDAARRTLQQVREEGEREVQDAIRSARGNLESLGGQAVDALDAILDVGPLPARVRRQVRQVTQAVEQGLRFDLTQARRELASAQSAAALVGTLTPAQRQAQNEFLAPFRARVAEAQKALETFKTDDAITELDKLEEKLRELQEITQRRKLRFDLTQAKRDLRDAQKALVQVGQLTPEQKRAQQEFLDPFKEKVLDAKAAAAEFDLSQQQKELKDTKEEAVKAADQGIQRLILRFEDGKVSADEFQRLLRAQLGPAFDIVRSKAAAALDPLLVRNFKQEVEDLVAQVQALAPFFPLGAGTTPGSNVIKPTATQAQVNQRIAESAASLDRIERNARTLSKQEQEKQKLILAVLRQIRDALQARPSKSGVWAGPR